MKLSDAELTRLAVTEVIGLACFPLLCEEDYGAASYPKAIQNILRQWVIHTTTTAWHVFDPLADWSAAGEIVVKMRADGWRIVVEEQYNYFESPVDLAFKVKFWRSGVNEIYGPPCMQFQRAVTLAALLAVGAITEDQV